MLPISLMASGDIASAIADRARVRRLALGHTRDDVAARAGISTESLKRFERTGKVAFDSLIRLAIALDAIEGFEQLFEKKPTYSSLDDVLQNARPRQRGRRRPARSA